MNLILQSLIPLAFVIILGWFAGWRKIIDARHSSSLATYVMSFSFLVFFSPKLQLHRCKT
jgi:malonate transporter and related proteins